MPKKYMFVSRVKCEIVHDSQQISKPNDLTCCILKWNNFENFIFLQHQNELSVRRYWQILPCYRYVILENTRQHSVDKNHYY